MAEKRVKSAFVSQRGKCLTALLKKMRMLFALKCCKLLTTHGGGALAVAKGEEGVGEDERGVKYLFKAVFCFQMPKCGGIAFFQLTGPISPS